MTYNPQWEDMSDYVVHFTRADKGPDSDYENIMGILGNQVLEARKGFGCAKDHAPSAKTTQNAVCFSEIPLHMLARLVERRESKYGIGFRKELVRVRGANPIWYVEADGRLQKALSRLKMRAANDADDPIWVLTPFVDIRGSTQAFTYEFEWEREWRHRGDFKFTEVDVTFLLIPEELHTRARAFFENAQDQNSGPAYLCPYLDPTWSLEKIREALGNAGPDRTSPP
jgi:hypothetical protein